jgi:hypothetical protein
MALFPGDLLKRITKRLETTDGSYDEDCYRIEVSNYEIVLTATCITVFDDAGFELQYPGTWNELLDMCICNARRREYICKLLELDRIL